MSKGKKVINYIAIACAIMASIFFFIDKDWNAFLWTIIALIWMVNCHLAEDTCYSFKESLDKLTDDYIKTLIKHGKEVKELKDEIESLNKGE